MAHLKALLEFLFIWTCSLSPIFLGVAYQAIFHEINYIQTVFEAFNNSPLFPYIASMVAPLLYVAIVDLSSKDNRKRSAPLGGIFLLMSILALLAASSEISIHYSGEETRPTDVTEFARNLFLCAYVAALSVLYYSIYITKRKPPDLEKNGRERSKPLMEAANKILGEVQ